MLDELVIERDPIEGWENADAAPAPGRAKQATVDAAVQGAGGQVYSTYLRWKLQPLSSTPALSIVIPAYNEAVRIVPTIGAMAAYVCALGLAWELIVADDGSRDETVALCTGLEMANLRVLIAEQNGGKFKEL